MIPIRQQLQWIKRAQAIAAGVTVLGLLAFLLIAYRPLTGRLGELRTQATSAELKIRKNEAAAKDLDAIKRDVERLRDQITRSRQLPQSQDLPRFIRDVTALSQSSRLQRFRYEPQSQKPQELCTELPITLQFGGPFTDVAGFLRQAEEMPRMTRTRKLSLRCRDGKSGIVDVDLSMSIFFAEAQ